MRRGKNVLFAACGLISLISSGNGVTASAQDAVDSPDTGSSYPANRASSNKGGSAVVSQQQGSKWGSTVEERQPSNKGGGKAGSEVSDPKPTYQSISAKSGASADQPRSPKEGSATSQQSNKWGSVVDEHVSSGKGGSASSKAGSAINCEWSSTPKIIETKCEATKKKTCVGEVECTENGSVPFKAEASCKLGGKGGVDSCSDATACANSDSGVGTASCEIKYYTPTDDQEVVPGPSSNKGGAVSR